MAHKSGDPPENPAGGKAKGGAAARAEARVGTSEGTAAAGGAKSKSPEDGASASGGRYVPRLKALYRDSLAAALRKEFGYRNAMMIPKLSKIVLNMGVGEAAGDSKRIKAAQAQLALIAGQHPVITRARRSIAGFKLREGMPIGCKVTLRKERMYDFVDRLITIALPRVRDFRGLPGASFDGRGNYALGIREHIVFPEIDYDKVDHMLGLDIIVCTTAHSNAEAKALLKGFNFPFMN